jgi:predicted dehydrogenase
MTETRKLRLGVVGVGPIAQIAHLPAIAKAENVTLAAACDVSPEMLEHARRLVDYDRAFTDYGTMLEQADLDAVLIPTANEYHAELALAALGAGKHVLVEKPLSTGASTTAELLRQAAGQRLVLMENMMFVRHRQHAVIGALLAQGAIGSLVDVRAVFTVPPRPAGDIRYQAALGGGSLLDQGVYPLRAAQLFLGTELTVLDARLRFDPRRAVDLGGTVLLANRAGAVARVEFGMDGEYACEYELTGTAGRIRLERAFTPGPEHRPQGWLADETGATRPLDLPVDDQFAAILRSFVASVRAADSPAAHGSPAGVGALGPTSPADAAAAASVAQAALVDRIRQSATVQMV